MTDPTVPPTTDEAHPLDEPLGLIHETALVLATLKQYALAERLANAHETIQQWAIQEPDRIARRCAEIAQSGVIRWPEAAEEICCAIEREFGLEPRA